MGNIKNIVNRGITVGDITVSDYGKDARIKIKDFYILDKINRNRTLELAEAADNELNTIIINVNEKFREYYTSDEVKFKFCSKKEVDEKLENYITKKKTEELYVPKILTAEKTIRGIVNFHDMRKQINNLSGAEYKEGNELGQDLKQIINKEIYYYNNKVYIAKAEASDPAGFTTPVESLFQNITNMELSKRISELEKVTILLNNQISSNLSNIFGNAQLVRVGKTVIFSGFIRADNSEALTVFNTSNSLIMILPYKPVAYTQVQPNLTLNTDGRVVTGGYSEITTRKVERAQHISFSYITND